MALPLPPGISQQTFDEAIARFNAAIGSQWVFTDEEDVLLYRDAYSPLMGEPEEIIPAAAVAPDNTEEVQAIVRIANELHIPLYAISTGKNLGYGGSAPNMSGSVVLDLKRMNRILEVNEKQAYCVVEPGVSYFDMYDHLKKNDIRLWMDVPDPGWGSLLGNAIDRGAGYTTAQFRNHFDAHCGMEVVLANGEVLRTGMGAMPGAKTWQSYKTGFGPWIDGIFSQSNFGIVTKMGFWMMPEPEAYLKGSVNCQRWDDLRDLLDLMTELENQKIFTGYPDIVSPALGSPGLAGVHEFMVHGSPNFEDPEYMALAQRNAPPQDYEAWSQSKGLPFWSCHFAFYGPEKVIRAQWEHVQEKYRDTIADVTFDELEFHTFPLSDEEIANVRYPAQFGIPSMNTFSIGARSPYTPNPSHGHIWFSPIIPREPDEIFRVNEILGGKARELGVQLGFAFNLPIPAWERSFIFIIAFFISEDPEQNKKTRDAFRTIVDLAAENGWGEYRTGTYFQGDIMNTYSFNNNALLGFHETLKDAVDPNGILSPGRYGIWPKHMREDQA